MAHIAADTHYDGAYVSRCSLRLCCTGVAHKCGSNDNNRYNLPNNNNTSSNFVCARRVSHNACQHCILIVYSCLVGYISLCFVWCVRVCRRHFQFQVFRRVVYKWIFVLFFQFCTFCLWKLFYTFIFHAHTLRCVLLIGMYSCFCLVERKKMDCEAFFAKIALSRMEVRVYFAAGSHFLFLFSKTLHYLSLWESKCEN